MQLFAISPDPTDLAAADGRHDFDGMFGRWSVAHRRLRRRLRGDDRWDEFAGVTEFRPIMGGLGNLDDNWLELPEGAYRAATVRQFDATSRRWSIWWIDGRVPGIQPPVQGRFENGVGTFFGDDTLAGRPILVRFLWSGMTGRAARWEQAFSDDAGATWESNWVMEFARAG